MSENNGLKSRLELALERLQQQDAAAGVDRRPLTDAQRAAIAEIRNISEAKLAELDVMHDDALKRTWDPQARTALEEEHRRTRERLTSERDAKIERVRAE